MLSLPLSALDMARALSGVSGAYAITAVFQIAAMITALLVPLVASRRSLAVIGGGISTLWAMALVFGVEWPWASVLDCARGGAWLMFLFVTLRTTNADEQRGQVWLGVIGLVAIPAIGLGLGLFGGRYNIAAVEMLQAIVDSFVLLLLEARMRHARERKDRWHHLCYLVAGLLVVFDLFFHAIFASTVIADERLAMVRAYLLAPGWLLIILGTADKRPWRSDITVSRRVALNSTALISIGFYLVTTSLCGEFLRARGGYWGQTIEVSFIAGATVTLMALLRSPAVRARLVVLVSKHFFRLKYDYREVWLNFIRKMAAPDPEGRLAERSLKAMSEAVRCDAGAIWVQNPATESYMPVAHWQVGNELPVVAVTDPLPAFLIKTGWVIDIQECEQNPTVYGGLVLPRWFGHQRRLWVVVPLIHNNALEAFIVLGNPQVKTTRLNWEDLDLLKTVGAQIAGYLAEERAARELTNTRRLAEFNQRFAFVAHDIKNVIAQMSLLLENARRFGDHPDFQKDMLNTIANSTGRLQNLLIELSNRSPDDKDAPEAITLPFDLSQSVAETTRRWRLAFPLIASGLDQPLQVLGDPARLSSALDHLIQNATEAVGQKGCVTIKVRASRVEGIVEIIDDGPGMTPEFIRTRLFRPLDTSKPNGSGIGAFQSLRMIQDMGGALEVLSEVGKGTTMRIRLKRSETRLRVRSLA